MFLLHAKKPVSNLTLLSPLTDTESEKGAHSHGLERKLDNAIRSWSRQNQQPLASENGAGTPTAAMSTTASNVCSVSVLDISTLCHFAALFFYFIFFIQQIICCSDL